MQNTKPLTLATAFGAFIALGFTGLLGVAWPSIRQTFELPQDAMGVLLFTSMLGNIGMSMFSGRLQARLRLGTYLSVSSLLMSAGMMGYALAPTWIILLGAGMMFGAGFGALNAGINTYLATNHGSRSMLWAHASFGLGATSGRLMLTALLTVDQSWRVGYVIVGLMHGLFMLWFILTRRHWHIPAEEPDTAGAFQDAPDVPWRETLGLPVVWAGMMLFFISAGVQVTAGQWSYTLFTEGRGVAEAVAGVWVSMLWGATTLGRILFGFVGARVRPAVLLRLCSGGLIAGAALMWWNPVDTVSFLGLMALGFSIAPFYPLLVSITPKLAGVRHAPNMIGFQISASNLGGTLVPGFAGVLAERISMEAIPPLMFTGAAATLLLHEVGRRFAAAHAQPGPETHKAAMGAAGQ